MRSIKKFNEKNISRENSRMNDEALVINEEAMPLPAINVLCIYPSISDCHVPGFILPWSNS
jgi:hypothetical protein